MNTETQPLAPWLGPADRAALEMAYHLIAPRTVLEWGAGGDSIWLCEQRRAAWHVIEHDQAWADRVRDASTRLPIVVHPVILPVDVAALRTLSDEYRLSESEQGKELWAPYWDVQVEGYEEGEHAGVAVPSPDLVIIDGRARVHCLRRALRFPPSNIMLHDAQRPEYRAALLQAGARWLTTWNQGQWALLET